MFDAGEIRFSSLHNFCPSPAGSPMTSIDCSKFSAASAEERERAVTQTLQSIDLAGQLSACVHRITSGTGEHVTQLPSG